MLVSVVIPVYNCAPFIQETLESVLSQTHSNLEILVCDDSSTDSTVEIIRRFNDNRIRLFESPQNKGQAHQLNKGISLAKGDYIAIMHGDDLCYPDRIETQLAYMESNPTVDICGCWIDFAGDWKKYKYSGGIYKYFSDDGLLKLNLLEGVPFAHPSVFLRKSLVDTGLFVYKQEYVPAEDWELWVRLAPHVRFGNVEKPLVTYRIHDNQISVTAAERFENCVKYIRQQYFKSLYHFSADEAVTLEEFIYKKEVPATSQKLHLLFSFLKRSSNGNTLKHEAYRLQKLFLNQTVVAKIQAAEWQLVMQFIFDKNVARVLGIRSVGGLVKRRLFGSNKP